MGQQLFIVPIQQDERRRPPRRRFRYVLIGTFSTLLSVGAAVYIFSIHTIHPLQTLEDMQAGVPVYATAHAAEAYESLPTQQELQQTTETAIAQTTGWEGLNFPVPEKYFQKYTSPFGFRQHPFGGRRFHYGLDLATPMNAEVRAWATGQVVLSSDNLSGCGTAIAVQSNDWYSVFCHGVEGSNKYKVGDFVHAGDVLQLVGMTGGTTGPHLHWGLKYQGKWVDPNIVLLQMRAAQGANP